MVDETSIASKDSGVVSKQSGGSFTIRLRAAVFTSPCHNADRLPNREQYLCKRTSRLLSSALIGQSARDRAIDR
jgi:hypothetical protein